MTNLEFFWNDIYKIGLKCLAVKNGKPCNCKDINDCNKECAFRDYVNCETDGLKNWLLEEHKEETE